MKRMKLLLAFSVILCACHNASSTVSSLESISSIDNTSSTVEISSSFSTSSNNNEMWDLSQDYLRTGVKKLNFYNLNDFHGAVAFDSDNSEPGINKLSTYIKNLKKEKEGFLFTNSGDMWQGSADSNLTNGALVIDWLNELGCYAQCIGNHEFDWGVETIKSNIEKMNFPLLACNIISKSENKPVDWLKPYHTATINGVHVGIIGAIGRGQTHDILAANVADLTFEDPIKYVPTWSKYLKDNGADVIMLLLHDSVLNISESISDYVDLIFGGHTHTGESYVIGGIPTIQAYCNGKDIGHIEGQFDFSSSTYTYQKSEYLDTRSFRISSLVDDPNTANIYNTYLEEQINEIKNEKVGFTNNALNRDEISNLSNKYNYSYYLDNHYNEDIEIFAVETNNSRSSINVGYITYGDIYKALPFDNCLCLAKTKASNLIHLASYSSAHFYIPSDEVYLSSSSDRLYQKLLSFTDSNDEMLYFLMIDYIATYESYSNFLEVVETYQEADALPRNVMKTYIHNDYPLPY